MNKNPNRPIADKDHSEYRGRQLLEDTKCTCLCCNHKFIQLGDRISRYIRFDPKCPKCGMEKVKTNKEIRSAKLKISKTKTEYVTDKSLALIRKNNCNIGAKEITCGYMCGERVDAIMFNLQNSFLIETKISREDFLKDSKKDFRINPQYGVGDYRYFACPEGLIKQEELPDKWGLIYVPEGNKRAYTICGYEHWDCDEDGKRYFNYEEQKAYNKSFLFEEKATGTEYQMLVSLCKRYKTRTGESNLL